MTKVKHPVQPVVMKDGVARFKSNAIVRALLDTGKLDMNDIVGYSLSGFGDLSYVTAGDYERASTQTPVENDDGEG